MISKTPKYIAYATDDNYAQHVGVSLLSLFSTVLAPTTYHVFIICNNLSKENKCKLAKIAGRFNNELEFIDCNDLTQLLPEDINTANLSLSTYCRLFAAELLPIHVTEVLYLDCDTLINDDLSELFSIDIEDKFVAGVEDTMYDDMKTSIFIDKDSSYINAGVLLINLKRWRNYNIVDEFLTFIHKFGGNVPHLDQGVINGVLKDRKIVLPLKFNVQAPIFAFHQYVDMLHFFSLKYFYTQNEVEEAKKHPVIIHYTSFFLERPWFRFCIHPLRNKYRDYLAISPFSTKLQPNKISFLQKLKDILFKYCQSIYLKVR